MTTPRDEHLAAWIEGDLSPAEAAALEAELARDPSLRATAARLRAARDLVRREGPVAAPPALAARVLGVIEAEPAPRRRVPWQPLLLAAVALLVLWVAWPQPDGTDLRPGAAVEDAQDAPVATFDGRAVVVAPSGWRLATQVPTGDVAAALEEAGADVRREGDVLFATVPAQRAEAVRAALGRVGVPEALDAPRAVRGRVELRVEVVQ